jgi:hypothetical protein
MSALNRFLPSWRGLSVSLLLACAPLAGETMETPAPALAEGIDQLRQSVGTWNVTTTQYQEDGTVAQTVEGTYQFDWVVPDRVVSGRSTIPSLGQTSGILFYVNERRSTIEMVSVGADGHLWFMTGPAGGETRTAPVTPLADGGESWKPGNHQRFVRATGEAVGAAGLRYRKRSQNYVPLT